MGPHGPFLPELARRKDGRGRPWKENRAVLNDILWILRTGAPWADLPDRYPSYQTCHRRFQQWFRAGVLRSILEILAHRRQCLRVGQTGCGPRAPWRGIDCATPQDPDTADARRSPAASLPTAVEDRATLCLVAELSADRR